MINVNEYFNGNVKSLGYESAEGKSTVGVIESGEYEFGTAAPETMIIIEGALDVLIAGEEDWELYSKGQSFNVAANTSFKVRAEVQTSYLCKYH